MNHKSQTVNPFLDTSECPALLYKSDSPKSGPTETIPESEEGTSDSESDDGQMQIDDSHLIDQNDLVNDVENPEKPLLQIPKNISSGGKQDSIKSGISPIAKLVR